MTINKKHLVFIITAVVLASILFNTLNVAQAQTTAFSSDDKFLDPTQNSTISFYLNGTYSSATLEQGKWVFRDLTFEDPKLPYFDLSGIKSIGNLSISARDCNVTVWIYLNAVHSYPIAIISYFVEGNGSQTVNLGLNSSSTDVSEWSIVDENDVFLAEGKNWSLLADDTIAITPPYPGNFTVMHFDFNDPEAQKLLPFWMQHSIILLVIVILSITVFIASLVTIKRIRKNTSYSS